MKIMNQTVQQEVPQEMSIDKKVSCDCGWEFISSDEDKLVEAVKEHAEKVHNMSGVTREQALAQAKPV
jgi:predicted small metal-binding protein